MVSIFLTKSQIIMLISIKVENKNINKVQIREYDINKIDYDHSNIIRIVNMVIKLKLNVPSYFLVKGMYLRL